MLFFSGLSIFEPFSSPASYMAYFAGAAFVVVFLTSFLYFSIQARFRKIKKIEHQFDTGEGMDEDEQFDEEEKCELIRENYRVIHILLFLFGIVFSVVFYLFVRNALYSLHVDALGNWITVFAKKNILKASIAEGLLGIGIMGFVWGWTRFFQILLIDDIFERYQKLVKVIPYYSAFMMLAFMIGVWFFYSNLFPFWWYLLTYTVIYGLIFFFSMKDFKKRIRMHLSQSIEFEDDFSLKTISIIGGIVITLLIVIFHLVFKTMPATYIIMPFIFLWLVSMYMTPGKLFRQIKIFPRYSITSARMLNFVKYTRRYLITWLLIIFFLGLLLGWPVLFEENFTTPKAHLDRCSRNLTDAGETLENYMKQNNGYLPDGSQWKSGEWLEKVRHNRKIDFVAECPSGGTYIYRKWRNSDNKPVYEIKCLGNAHQKAGVRGAYPRYIRFRGLVYKEKKPESPANNHEQTENGVDVKKD